MDDDSSVADETNAGDDKAGNPLVGHLKSGATWMRFLFMLISSVLGSVASLAGSVIVVLGFFWVLFTGEVNRQIQQAGQSVASYIYGIIRYLTFNTDVKPFPLGGEWPSGEPPEDEGK